MAPAALLVLVGLLALAAAHVQVLDHMAIVQKGAQCLQCFVLVFDSNKVREKSLPRAVVSQGIAPP